MFKQVTHAQVSRGNFFKLLFTDGKRTLLYVSCILIGLPIWYAIGILIALSQQVFGKAIGVAGDVTNSKAVMFSYIGLSIGDLLSGLLSQLLRSRRKVVFIYLGVMFGLVVYFLYFSGGISVSGYYLLCLLLGTATGYWAIFVTIASEQFGTNIRSTVTNTVPNFVRGAVIPITAMFQWFALSIGDINSAFVVGLICFALATIATIIVKETFAKDLNYIEMM
jgi:hypothetical protein